MATSEHDLKAPLVQRLRFRADLESPDRDFDWETSDATPEVSWSEMLEIVALLREAAEALERLNPERAQWQPIETAPKDGTRILVCRHMESFGWILGHAIHEPDFDCWIPFGLGVFGELGLAFPTHWMPLPAAPGAEPTADRPLSFSDPQKAKIIDLLEKACVAGAQRGSDLLHSPGAVMAIADRLLAQEVPHV